MFQAGRSNDSRWRRAFLRSACFCFSVALGLTGCRSRSDLVEAELRTRENEVRQLRTELQRSEMFNHALTHEMLDHPNSFPVGLPGGAVVAPDAPISVMGNMVKEVILGRGTGGVDEDGKPGDEALMVVVIPKDVGGSEIKAPGNLVVQVSEISSNGVKVPLSRWDIPALELQRMWKSGLLSSGYHIKLPWKVFPSTEKLRVAIRLTTLPDNRVFEADKDVTIRLMPGIPLRPIPPADEIPIGPKPPEETRPPPVQGPQFNSAVWPSREPAARIDVAKPAPSGADQPARLLEPNLND